MRTHESETIAVSVILAFIIFAAVWLGYLILRPG